MESRWLGFGKAELSVEQQQLADEGAALPPELAKEMGVLLSDETQEEGDFWDRAKNLLEKTDRLPTKRDYPFVEPSDLAEIHAARPKFQDLQAPQQLDQSVYDRIYGAWLGRCSGCLLGKPIEGLVGEDIWNYLRKIGQYPLTRYLDSSLPKRLQEKYTFDTLRGFIDQIDHMVEDDDMNYTVTALAVMAQFGWDFTPEDVAAFWLENIPAYHTFTAERVAYRNILLVKNPPESGTYCNPYREWIGAQIRGDFWGYVCPGEPERAAALAWRDACVSHTKNGIYGEMWSAAMNSAAAVLDDPHEVLEAGLAQVPEKSRLTYYVREAMGWFESGKKETEVIELIHKQWDDANPHHWCHTLSNAQIVVLGLLWGSGDFERSISWAVTAGFDTDCNGATVGSIIGMMKGAKALPEKWIAPLNDRLDTGISGYHHVRISEMAKQTLEFAEAGR
jgi:hypothetical protein